MFRKMCQNILKLTYIPIYYKKWFRFYWDFCHKYEHPVNDKKSLSYFINKL